MSFFEFPHTRTYDNDLGWLIRHIIEMSEKLDNFINFNTIKYADPIEWNITRQYEANTVVIDALTGNAYISTHPVPSGVNIGNTEYWTPIFNYDRDTGKIRSAIADNLGSNTTAPEALAAGRWVWLNGILYRTTADMAAGTAFIYPPNIGANVEEIRIENLFGDLSDTVSNLDDVIGNLFFDTAQDMISANELREGNICFTNGFYATNDGGSAIYHISATNSGTSVALANGLYANVFDNPINIKKIGAHGDGSEDIGVLVNAALDAGREVYIPKGTYLVTTPIILKEGRKVQGGGKALGGFWSGNHDAPVLIINADHGFISEVNGGFTLRDMLIVGYDRAGKTNSGITFRNSPTSTITAHSLISNVNFFYLKYGIQLSLDDAQHETIADDLIVENCYFDFCKEGIQGHSYGIEITQCIFADMEEIGIHMINGSGIIANSKLFGAINAMDINGNNYMITGCEFDGCTDTAIVLRCKNSTVDVSIYGDCLRGIDIYGYNNSITAHFTIAVKPTTSGYGTNPTSMIYFRGDSSYNNVVQLMTAGNTSGGVAGYVYAITDTELLPVKWDYVTPNVIYINGVDASPTGIPITNLLNATGLTYEAPNATGTFVTGHLIDEGILAPFSGNRLKMESADFAGGVLARKVFVRFKCKYDGAGYMMAGLIQEGVSADNTVVPATLGGENQQIVLPNSGGISAVSVNAFSTPVKRVTVFFLAVQAVSNAVPISLKDIEIEVFPISA